MSICISIVFLLDMTGYDTPSSQWWVLCCTEELNGTVMGIPAPFQYGVCPQPALGPFVCGSQGHPMSLAKRGPRRGASTRFPMQGNLKATLRGPRGDKRAQRYCPHPHPEEKGQALLFGVLSRCFAKKYQILGVLKGTLM